MISARWKFKPCIFPATCVIRLNITWKLPPNAAEWIGRPRKTIRDQIILSSSRKRLAPQLIFKGGIINAWGKKSAVALNKGFFDTLPKLPEVPKAEADIAWLIYDLKSPEKDGAHYELFRERVVYTKRPVATNLELKEGEPLEKFERRLVCGLDEVVV